MNTDTPTPENSPESDTPQLNSLAALPDAVTSAEYTVADFAAFEAVICSESFYQESYDGILLDLVAHVLSHESPISETNLIQRIARGHQFQKAGRLIRERILECAETHFHLKPDPLGGRFVWRDIQEPGQWATYRVPPSDEHLRKLEDIPLEELRAASLGITGEDAPLELARIFGIRRLGAANRERIEMMLRLCNGGA